MITGNNLFESFFICIFRLVGTPTDRVKWNLAAVPEEYHWSSAKFYEHGIDEFGIVSDYRE